MRSCRTDVLSQNFDFLSTESQIITSTRVSSSNVIQYDQCEKTSSVMKMNVKNKYIHRVFFFFLKKKTELRIGIEVERSIDTS